MEIKELAGGDVVVVGLIGRLDALTAERVRQDLLARLTGPNPRLILDLSQLDYMSSAGLRVFLEVAKRVSAGKGKVALCETLCTVNQVFELAGFGSFIPFYASRQEALIAMS